MPASYYSEPDQMDEAAPNKAGDMEKDDDGGETALLPKSILAGKEFKPGEEVVFKIVHDHGDEIEVAYATGEEEEKKPRGTPEMDEATGKLGMMGEE